LAHLTLFFTDLFENTDLVLRSVFSRRYQHRGDFPLPFRETSIQDKGCFPVFVLALTTLIFPSIGAAVKSLAVPSVRSGAVGRGDHVFRIRTGRGLATGPPLPSFPTSTTTTMRR